MPKLDVKYFQSIYRIRQRMLEDGLTKSDNEVKQFVELFLRLLSKMPPDEEIKIEGRSYLDSKGKVIATFPLTKP